MKNKNRVLLVFMFLWVVICFSSGEALAVSWNEAISGTWSEPTNWSGGVVPGLSDHAEITVEGTYTVTLDVDATIAGLTLGASNGTQTLAATGRTLTINGASTINSNGVMSLSSSTLGGSGELKNQGTMNISNSTIDADLVNEGSLTASNTCDINGEFSNESVGALSLSYYSTLTVGSGFTNQGAIEMNRATLTGGGALITLVNQGSINPMGSVGSSLYMELDNQGMLTLDRGLTLNQPSAAHTNSGTITVSGASLTLTQSGTDPSFTNTGTIDIGSGLSFTVNGGVLIHNGTFTGSGTLSVSAGTFNLATALSNLMTLSLSNTDLNGPGELTNQGTMSISNSTINADLVNEDSLTVSNTCDIKGKFSNESVGALSLSYYSTLTVGSGFTNQGAIEMNRATLTGGGALITLVNQGSINPMGSVGSSLYMELDNQGMLTLDRGLTLNQPSAAHTNSGTITVSGASLTLTQSGTDPSFTNTGTIDIGSGLSFTVNGGVLIHNGTFTGSGTLSVSAGTFNLATALSNLMTLSLSNTDLNGPGELTNQGTMSISNSTINADLVNEDSLTVSNTCDIKGKFSNESVGALSLSYYSTLTVGSGFTNQGAIEMNRATLTGGGALITLVNQGSINPMGSVGSSLYMELDNQGMLTLDRGLTLNQPSAAHTNSGTITVSGASLTLTQSGTDPSFTNTGTIDIGSGLSFTVNGGVLIHNGTFTGSGTLSVSAGTFNLATALSNLMTLSLSNTDLNGPGELTNQGTMSISNSTINADLVNEDSLTVSNTCDIKGKFSNESVGALSLSYYSTLTVDSGFTNQGAIEMNRATLTGGGALITLVNQGSINPMGSVGSSLYMELDNQGMLTLDRGLTLNQPSAAHTNSGTITVSGASLTLTQSGTDPSFTNTGTIDIGSGLSFTVNGGTLENATTGIIQGTGTLKVSGTSFTNAGTINPGTSPGILTVIGDFPQKYTAALNIEIGGLTAGTQYDRLDISGSTALAGALDVTLINGFEPVLDNTFQIVTYTSHTGIFSSSNLPALSGGLDWDIYYGGGSIDLRVILPITVCVDDDNVDGPWDGSPEHPFNTIQAGVDSSSPGDTVYVSAGEYEESISIDKNTFLVGEDPEVTIIDGSGEDGPAVYCVDMARGEITGFHIKNGTDAGIQCEQSTLLIRKNIISDTISGDGIKMGAWSSVTIENNLIYENDLNGILFEGTAVTVVNNTIVSNGVHGISCWSGEGVVIKNNIIVTNGDHGISCDQLEPEISYNNVWDNTVGDYSGCDPGTGDISADPQFEDLLAYGLHIMSGSPCIDAGTSDGAPEFDFEGKERYDDPDTEPNTGSGSYTYYDIGAYEYYLVCECDLNTDGTCDMQDWLLFGEDWGRTDCNEPGTEECECDLNGDGRCDMQDWLLFGEDWGRTDCPIYQ